MSRLRCPSDWHESRPDAGDVRQAVEATGMTQGALAAAMGFKSRATVVKWLSGETRINWPAWRLLLALAHEASDEG